MRKLLCSLLVFLLLGFFLTTQVLAEECSPSCGGIEECQRKISECQKLLEMSVSATKPHEDKLKELEGNIAAIDANVRSLQNEIEKKKTEIGINEQKLGLRQQLFETQVRDFYKKDYQSDFEYVFTGIIAGGNVADTLQVMGYRQSMINQEKKLITSLVMEITDLNNSKKQLEDSQVWLAGKRASLETVLAPIRQLVAGARTYQSQLSQTVGSLSARQQSLLAEKTGNFATSVGDVPAADDPASRPSYNPGFSPAFAAFSFGAPHYKGLSQYGAYGRAKGGQNAEEILKAYYGPGIELKKDYSTEINISVNGHGTYKIEDYVKRIYEMPASWTDNDSAALKAQAVAARSYALAYTNNGSKSICATESCQVFKPQEKGGAWNAAVDATRGWVLVANGQPFSAFYAASSGGYQESYNAQGYSTPGFWDTTSDWTRWADGAWEVKANSPWFYKAWYRKRSGENCGRSHPWLNQSEFSDIINSVIVYSAGGDTSGMFPEDVRSCYGGNDNPWSKSRMAEEANKHGGAVSSISSIRVEHSNGGYTSKVIVQTDRGEMQFSGKNFKQAFTLRAPGAIQIKSGLFNIEKK